MIYTANPELDAARHYDLQDAREAHKESQQIAAYSIVLKELLAVTAAQWSTQKISGGANSTAETIFYDALDMDEESQDRFHELMTCEQARKFIEAMASFHANNHYAEILQPLSPDVVRKLQRGGNFQCDAI